MTGLQGIHNTHSLSLLKRLLHSIERVENQPQVLPTQIFFYLRISPKYILIDILFGGRKMSNTEKASGHTQYTVYDNQYSICLHFCQQANLFAYSMFCLRQAFLRSSRLQGTIACMCQLFLP